MLNRFSYLENSDALSLIEVLAEIFTICEPDENTLRAEANENEEDIK